VYSPSDLACLLLGILLYGGTQGATFLSVLKYKCDKANVVVGRVLMGDVTVFFTWLFGKSRCYPVSRYLWFCLLRVCHQVEVSYLALQPNNLRQ